MKPRLPAASAAFCALVLAVAGCASSDKPASPASASGSSGAPSAGAVTPAASTSPSGSDTAGSTTPGNATPGGATPSDATPSDASATPGSASSDLGDPVGTRNLTQGGDQLTLRVYAPQRQDQLVTLTVDLTFVQRRDETAAPDSAILADKGPYSIAKRVPNGFGLVDTAGQKMYLPATTGDGSDTAECFPTFPNTARKGDTFTFSCIFAGVPQNLSTVTVRSQTFGNFPNVRIK